MLQHGTLNTDHCVIVLTSRLGAGRRFGGPCCLKFTSNNRPRKSSGTAFSTTCATPAVSSSATPAPSTTWWPSDGPSAKTLIDREILTRRTYDDVKPKTVHYLSMEYLLGRLLTNNLIATGLLETAREAMQLLGLNLDTIVEEESDPGLGNGGLGRLAACFLDSLATLDYPSYGYGLRYDYGMFRQGIENGWQVEQADTWLEDGFPWEIARNDRRVAVRFGGTVEWSHAQETGKHRPVWTGWREVYGVPHDILIAGYGTNTVGVLRLWDARAASEFDFQIFSQGGFVRAVEERERVEAVNRVLYPADDVEAGRRLRLTQEYFLVACSVRDVMERFRQRHGEAWELLPDKVALQLNDTHPALTVAELMRYLLDEAGLRWTLAWELTRSTCAYTNHTLLPEALETWPVSLMEPLIPRHVQIIFEINRRFMSSVKPRFAGKLDGSNGSPSSRKTARSASAWPTWRSSGATRSTASPNSTPSSSRPAWSRTSPSCGRRSSCPSPTASRRGGGSWPATRGWRRPSAGASATAGRASSTACRSSNSWPTTTSSRTKSWPSNTPTSRRCR